MKKLLILLVTFALLASNIKAEIITEGTVIDLNAIENPTSSLDIKDIIKANLLRSYGEDKFQIDVKQLPSVNDDSYLLTQITEKPIVIKPDELTIDGKIIEFVNGNAFVMPLTKYQLAKNLRIKAAGDKVKIEDSKFSFNADKVVINSGIVFINEDKIPVKVMPNMIYNDLTSIFGEDKIRKVEIETKKDNLKYSYLFETSAKLFLSIDMKMNINIIVDAKTGKYSIDKPIWAVFASGENKNVDSYDFTKYGAFK